jgi:hypothetical protein
MTIIYAAATVYVNPPGETPVLSLEQLWKGLELKVRYVHCPFLFSSSRALDRSWHHGLSILSHPEAAVGVQ